MAQRQSSEKAIGTPSSSLGYTVREQVLRDRGRIGPSDVVKSLRLVTPSGSVLSAGLFWIEVQMTRGTRMFPVALKEFHDYVELPVIPLWSP